MSDIAVALQPFVSGGVAACFASTAIHPIDLIKVRLQLQATVVDSAAPRGFFPIAKTMLQNEGVASLYSGLSAALLRQAIYGTARIGLHRSFSDKLVEMNDGKQVSFLMKTLSGMASGAIAVCIGTPMDVALVRMQSDSMRPAAERFNYSNVFNALGRIAKEEGVSTLYSGLTPNILRGMSMNVGMMACYDQAKELVSSVSGQPLTALPVQLGASAIAGFTAAAFSLPFDLCKSRLQSKNAYTGVVDVFTQTLKKEGPLAFWTGFGAYYGRCAPHAMIILMMSERVKVAYEAIFGIKKK